MCQLRYAAPLFLLFLGCADGSSSTASDTDPTDATEADISADAAAPDAESDASTDVGGTDAGEPTIELVTGDAALDFVDVFIGTGGFGFGFGGMTPAAQVPLGMVKLGPDSTAGGNHPPQTHFGGYYFDDPDVRGFSHLHFVGTGAVDYGNLRVAPVRDPAEHTPDRLVLATDKASESASPGYYTITLPEEDVRVELAASSHGGFHRYTFGGDEAGHILIDPASAIVDDPNIIDARITMTEDGFDGFVLYRGGFTGRTQPFPLYFSATVTPSASAVWTWGEEGYDEGATEATGTRLGGVMRFDAPSEPIELRVGLSYVDVEQAVAHREEQLDGRTLEEIQADAEEAWAEILGRVRLPAQAPPDLLTRFYTAHYNCYRMPSWVGGTDGRYRGFDDEVNTANGFRYLTDLSLWDSFRTTHPWYELTDNQTARDSMASLLAMNEAGGRMPRWPAAMSYTGSMIGSSADFVFAGAALKEIDGIDYDEAFDALIRSNEGPRLDPDGPRGREGIEDYHALGYLPSDDYDESVSKALEYYYADFALAEMAAHLGRTEEEAWLRERSLNFSEIYNPDLGVFWPRQRSGDFEPQSSLTSVGQRSGPFTEGNAWHWRFYAIHAGEELATLMGGQDVLDATLDEFFERSGLGSDGVPQTTVPDLYYWHGNQPAIHVAFLYHAVDSWERMSYWVRQIQLRLYTTEPRGLPGNDDGGTMSAWFTFTALGLYPLAGSDSYFVATPLFEYAEVDTAAGTLTLRADGASEDTFEVGEVRLNGTALETDRVRHADLIGGELEFTMVQSTDE